jgi:feruloyl esterase
MRLNFALAAGLFFAAACGTSARASDYQNLPVVKPVVSCDQLAKAELAQAVGVPMTIKSATERDTDKGKYCKVTGTIAPAVGFEVDLPLEHWTQRFVQAGCGGMCGTVNASIGNAGTCAPALNGEFAVAGDDMGHSGGMGGPGAGGPPSGSFGTDPDARIDFAYRANHETTLVAKALIKAFYGQPQKFAYFTGCSDGGREALAEAERYPNDFDGISAGAPVLAISVHNSFFHGWENVINKRPDGSPILLRSRLSIVREAVAAHCPTLSGVEDGLLEDPFSCKFDPAWIQCPASAADTSKCLTAEETAVLKKYYEGASDAQGHAFTFNGYTVGSEFQWGLPQSATAAQGPGGGMASGNIKYLLMPKVLTDAELASFTFNEDWFAKVNEVGAPLYNAGNTNLRPFESRGGKLILWHGLADESMPAATTIAFYQGVQKVLGDKVTDSFVRLFLIPGVGHCGGGLGFPQIDTLSPLMAWTEMKQAPQVLIAGKTANQQRGPGGPLPAGPGGAGAPPSIQQGGPGAPGGAQMAGAGGPGAPGGPGGRPPSLPYAQPAQPTLATRPVYAYPYVAKYKGSGDKNDAANFEPVKVPGPLPLVFNTEETKVIGPDNQKFFHAENGAVVADKK